MLKLFAYLSHRCWSFQVFSANWIGDSVRVNTLLPLSGYVTHGELQLRSHFSARCLLRLLVSMPPAIPISAGENIELSNTFRPTNATEMKHPCVSIHKIHKTDRVQKGTRMMTSFGIGPKQAKGVSTQNSLAVNEIGDAERTMAQSETMKEERIDILQIKEEETDL